MSKAPYGLSSQYIAHKCSFYISTCQSEHPDAEYGFLTKTTTLANQAPDSGPTYKIYLSIILGLTFASQISWKVVF